MCPRQESNLHVSQHSHLKRARLPFRHLGLVKEFYPEPIEDFDILNKDFLRHSPECGCKGSTFYFTDKIKIHFFSKKLDFFSLQPAFLST